MGKINTENMLTINSRGDVLVGGVTLNPEEALYFAALRELHRDEPKHPIHRPTEGPNMIKFMARERKEDIIAGRPARSNDEVATDIMNQGIVSV